MTWARVSTPTFGAQLGSEAQMKALISRQAGGPESLTLEDIAVPEPKAGQVRIRISCCAVSYPDTLMIADRYQYRPSRPFSPGQEIAGTVDALGEGLEEPQVGTRVLAALPYGGMAQFAVASAAHCRSIPDGMTFDDAAVLIGAYGTAYHAFMQRGTLRAGERLLVLGAAGGVGLAAVQIGHALGARVIAAVSDARRSVVARAHGADATLLYSRGPFDEAASDALRKSFKEVGPYDVVFDPVGGAYTEAALRAMARGGRLLIVGFTAGIARIPMNLPLLKECRIVGVFYGAFAAREPAIDAENVAALFRLYREGRIRPVISARYALADGARALTELAERRVTGRLIISMVPL